MLSKNDGSIYWGLRQYFCILAKNNWVYTIYDFWGNIFIIDYIRIFCRQLHKIGKQLDKDRCWKEENDVIIGYHDYKVW